MQKATIARSAIERVIIGHSASSAIAGEADRLGARRVLVLASGTLATQTDEVARIEAALGDRHVLTHHGISAHVPKADVLTAANRALDAKADMIVVVGGGSVIDAGKILALCLRGNIRTREGLNAVAIKRDAGGTIIPLVLDGPDVPVVIVPTTLSAGEYNPLSGATDEEMKRKQGFLHGCMAPRTIILDPAVTVHTPDWLWHSTGVRAMDHAVETLASLQSNDHADAMADGALRYLVEGLQRTKADPADLAARLKCQIGAWHSAAPLTAGVPMGASHAIGHALGAFAGVPHGYTSCVMLPYVQGWNAREVTHGQARIAACLGAPQDPVAETLDKLIAGLGMPRTLAQVDVRADQLHEIATRAWHDPWLASNPRPIEHENDVIAILELAQPASG